MTTIPVPEEFYQYLRKVIEDQVPPDGACVEDEQVCMALYPVHDGGRRNGVLTEVYAEVEGLIDLVLRALYTDHVMYLSTACLHDEHEHCNSSVAIDGGPKQAGKCKFCESRCVCPCHKVPDLV